MDPLSALVILVGLLCNWRQERGMQADVSHQEFVEWLKTHKHTELVELIASTKGLSIQIDELLRRNHDQILTQFNEVSAIMATLLSRLDGFAGLAKALSPDAELSDQAKAILSTFYSSDADLMFWHHRSSIGLFIPNKDIPLPITEPRFLENDLETLVSAGLLSASPSSDGGSLIFKHTRAGARFAELVKPN